MDCMNFGASSGRLISIITVCRYRPQLYLCLIEPQIRSLHFAAIRVRESGQIPAISDAFGGCKWRRIMALIITVKSELNTVSVLF